MLLDPYHLVKSASVINNGIDLLAARPRERIMNKQELAKDYHDKGFGCAQSVLAAYASEYGLDEETALRISTGFGSGMGRMCEVCGALTGAFMVIGLKHGKVITDGTKYGTETETAYRKVAELSARFEERNGSIYCRELIGHDLSDPDERAEVVRLGWFKTRCGRYINDAVELLEEAV
jgi:C_GCAxxG_C_C family probable redox protein